MGNGNRRLKQPTGLTIADEKIGELTWDTRTMAVGLYSASVTVTDSSLIHTSVDFLIEITEAKPNYCGFECPDTAVILICLSTSFNESFLISMPMSFCLVPRSKLGESLCY